MKDTVDTIENLGEHLKEYVNTRLDEIKLSVAEKSSKISANIIASIVVALFLLFFVLFAGTALAYALNDLTGKNYWGFLIVAGLFLGAGLWILLAKEKILRIPIMNSIINQLFNNEANHAED